MGPTCSNCQKFDDDKPQFSAHKLVNLGICANEPTGGIFHSASKVEICFIPRSDYLKRQEQKKQDESTMDLFLGI